jgi:AraC-like DNA-binding protein
MARTKIRQTINQVEAVRLLHPGLSELRDQGLWSAGIDTRASDVEWGEGHGPTHLAFLVVTGRVWPVSQPDCVAGPGMALLVPIPVAKRLACGAQGVTAAWSHWLSDAPCASAFSSFAQCTPIRDPDLVWPLSKALIRESHSCDGGHLVTESSSCRAMGLAWLQVMLAALSESRPIAQDRWNHALAQVWATVARHLNRPWDVRMLAATIGISAPHLHRLVRERMGHGPMAEVVRLRLERGRELLREGSSSIEAIAASVGFATPGAFSDAFVRRFSLRPGAVRRGADRPQTRT